MRLCEKKTHTLIRDPVTAEVKGVMGAVVRRTGGGGLYAYEYDVIKYYIILLCVRTADCVCAPADHSILDTPIKN